MVTDVANAEAEVADDVAQKEAEEVVTEAMDRLEGISLREGGADRLRQEPWAELRVELCAGQRDTR